MSTSVTILTRTVSKSIDLVLAMAVAEALPKAGWLAGLLYLLICDGLWEGQSVGKKLMGLRVVTAGGGICGIRESILRNLIFGTGLVLWKIPYLGWLLLAAVAALEFIVLLGSDDGTRLGDELAKTRVVPAGGHTGGNDIAGAEAPDTGGETDPYNSSEEEK